MPSFTLRATDFRVLHQLDWSPNGVCLLAGPNGSGKTTVLDTLVFLRGMFGSGPESALNAVGGAYLHRTDAMKDDPIVLDMQVDDLRWVIRLPMASGGLAGTFGEELYRGHEVVLRAAMFDESWYLGKQRLDRDERRCCTKVLWDKGEAAWMKPLVDVLTSIHVYKSYWLNQVQRSGPVTTQQRQLHGTGRNLWSVLSTWKAAPRHYDDQFEWVMSQARRAFPGIIDTVEFDRGLPVLFRPDATDPADGLPPERAPDGLLTGLLHLTAIAGARPGSILAFDEMENQLHPHAIRSLVRAMRDKAESADLTIILTTHSPVVMNEFKGEEDQFFVLTSSRATAMPVPLEKHRDRAWLSHFALGDLYERSAIAAPDEE